MNLTEDEAKRLRAEGLDRDIKSQNDDMILKINRDDLQNMLDDMYDLLRILDWMRDSTENNKAYIKSLEYHIKVAEDLLKNAD